MNKKNKFNKGFTLLETIVALGILAIGITGMFFILQDIENNFSYAKGYITAAYLNQEAVEFVRNIKDSNVYEPQDGEEYDAGILDGEYGPLYFEIDLNQSDLINQMYPVDSNIENNCFSISDRNKDCFNSTEIRDMKMGSSFPYYYYPSGSDTNPNANIKRIVKIEKIDANDGVNDYQTIAIESRTFFKIKNNYYMHKVIHYMYDR